MFKMKNLMEDSNVPYSVDSLKKVYLRLFLLQKVKRPFCKKKGLSKINYVLLYNDIFLF